jgi:hypothetical protein
LYPHYQASGSLLYPQSGEFPPRDGPDREIWVLTLDLKVCSAHRA